MKLFYSVQNCPVTRKLLSLIDNDPTIAASSIKLLDPIPSFQSSQSFFPIALYSLVNTHPERDTPQLPCLHLKYPIYFPCAGTGVADAVAGVPPVQGEGAGAQQR